MSRFFISHPATEAEELARLEDRLPVVSLLIGAVVAGEVAATLLMLIAQG